MIRWIIDIIKDNMRYLPRTYCLSRVELKKAHSSSDLGTFWAVAKPFMYILMFYFAISIGLKNAKKMDEIACPYFIWLASGIVQWQFISDLLLGGTTCFRRRKSIIHSIKYPLNTLPTASVLSRMYIYLIMVGVLIVLALMMGVSPSIYWLQLPLYSILTALFLYIWVLMTALMDVISADILEFIKTIRTAFFWLSGILFNIHGKKSALFTWNPISYLAEGFRNCFAYHIWIWDQRRLLMHFGIVLIIMTLVTFLLYKRLEKRLPELL